MLHHLLLESAKRFPDNIAVCDEFNEITYGELLRKSQSISLILREKYDADQNCVGILLEKSIQYVESIFGILQAGMTYVPLNTNLPKDKLKYILENTNIKVVITDKKHSDTIGNMSDTIVLDNLFLEYVSGLGQSSQPISTNMEDIAYILYTSGSTGIPKGIKISHRASLTFVHWAKELISASSNDVFASHAPFHFDLSIFDIFVSIAVGACLIICPKSVSSFPKTLVNFILEKKITIWYSVPSIIVQMSKTINFKQIHALRVLIYAGESMPVKFVKSIRQALSNTKMYNFYGPTETNVITFYAITEKDDDALEIPIGTACPYASIEIRDENGTLSDMGKIGELIVVTESLMTGYYGQEEFSPSMQYSTGDLVKIVGNNTFEYVGRIDNMVKVNGYRVELEEIENTIKRYPNINNCIVQVQNEDDKDILCCRYSTDISINKNELMEFLCQNMEEYKIPTRYFHSDTIKTNERGKTVREW